MRFIFTANCNRCNPGHGRGERKHKMEENEMKTERKRNKSSKKNSIAVRCLFTPFRA